MDKVKALRVSYGNSHVTIIDLFPFAAGRRRVRIPYDFSRNYTAAVAAAEYLAAAGVNVLGYAETSDHYIIFVPLDTIL